MPGFRYKDLMINVVPEGAAAGAQDAQLLCALGTYGPPCYILASCVGGTYHCTLYISQCTVHTICPPLTHCTYCSFNGTIVCLQGSICGPTIVGCTGTIHCGGSIVTPLTPVAAGGQPGPQELATLKEQLKQTLANIEQQEQAQAAAGQPQSVAEIESLQEKLRGAINELETQKKGLPKNNPAK